MTTEMTSVKYDFLFLIISSDDLPCYSKMREYARLYFSLYNTSIKYLFIQFDESLDCDVRENNDFLYFKGRESITPGMIEKTKRAMEYVNKRYDYDYLIRTNLSSFWNLTNLLKIKKLLPLTNYAGGVIVENRFISGTGIILTKDVCIKLANTIFTDYNFEDVYISITLQELGYTLNNLNKINMNMHMLVNDSDNVIPDDINNILYYRIKNSDRNNDIRMMELLCQRIYICSV
jgi:hypothetical protein